MISFIVIGKNEGWRLEKCFASIQEVIIKDSITDFEIIYVDSNSKDKSLEVARKFNVKSFLITGVCNAAIARNIGAIEASGKILFFIDGDMEILPGFLPEVLDEKNKLIYPFISGIFDDYIYDNNWEFERVSSRFGKNNLKSDQFRFVTGGLFMITKELWKMIGGMDIRLVRSQDYDLALRLSKINYPLLRKNILLARHHMIDYWLRKNSIWYEKYSAILTRKHIFNKNFFLVMIGSHYSKITLLFVILLVCFHSPIFIIIYITMLIYKSLRIKSKIKIQWFRIILQQLLKDIVYLFSFFFIYVNKVEVKYNHVV